MALRLKDLMSGLAVFAVTTTAKFYPKTDDTNGAGLAVGFFDATTGTQIGTAAAPIYTSVAGVSSGEYETVAASATAQILGATGAVGDYLTGLLIVPATTSPGAVSIIDGNGSNITVFTGGAASVSSLVPFFVPIEANCINATTPGWKVTTGTNVSVFATGNFT